MDYLPVQLLDVLYFYMRPGLPRVAKKQSWWASISGYNRRVSAVIHSRITTYVSVLSESSLAMDCEDTAATDVHFLLKSDPKTIYASIPHWIESVQDRELHTRTKPVRAGGLLLGFWRLVHCENIRHYLDIHRSVLAENPTPMLHILPFLRAHDMTDVAPYLDAKTLLAVAYTPYWERIRAWLLEYDRTALEERIARVEMAMELYRVRTDPAHIYHLFCKSPHDYRDGCRVLMDYTQCWLKHAAVYLEKFQHDSSHHRSILVFQGQCMEMLAHYAYMWTDPTVRTLFGEGYTQAMDHTVDSIYSYAPRTDHGTLLAVYGERLGELFGVSQYDRGPLLQKMIPLFRNTQYLQMGMLLGALAMDKVTPTSHHVDAVMKVWNTDAIAHSTSVLAQSEKAWSVLLQRNHTMVVLLREWTLQCRMAYGTPTFSGIGAMVHRIVPLAMYAKNHVWARNDASALDIFLEGAGWMVREHLQYTHVHDRDVHIAQHLDALRRIWLELDLSTDDPDACKDHVLRAFASFSDYVRDARMVAVNDADMQSVVYDLE